MTRFIQFLACTGGFAAIAMLYFSALGYQSGRLELAQAFTLARYAAHAGLAGLFFSLFFILWQRPLGVLRRPKACGRG